MKTQELVSYAVTAATAYALMMQTIPPDKNNHATLPQTVAQADAWRHINADLAKEAADKRQECERHNEQ